MSDDAARRLDTLEIRIAHQDQTIEDLNVALTEQWREIERLRREMKLLESAMREAAQAPGPSGLPEPPPPHY